MTRSIHSGTGGAIDEQARLARSLVDALGLDGAISACRANGWDGVLACLRGLRWTGGDLPAVDTPYQV